MAKVFISHRNVEPDLGLAEALRTGLVCAQHDVFLDAENILPGDEWPKVIQQEMEGADVLVVLLSESIAESPDMVTEEVAMAREMRRDGGRPRIVPVRVCDFAFLGLPYDLRAIDRRRLALCALRIVHRFARRAGATQIQVPLKHPPKKL